MKLLNLKLVASLWILATSSNFVAAGGMEGAKKINTIMGLSSGGYVVTLQQPTVSAECLGGNLAISTTTPELAQKNWLSMLISAKASNASINISYTGTGTQCLITMVQLI